MKEYDSLVEERARYLKAMDDAYPDVGWGMSWDMAVYEAKKQLKREGKIPQTYGET